ncbi:hypothetical protein BD311DRAFT_731503 [Dichomitus squalens]|uniref:Uncharacterized protein n=1 Tax=Dichomitus squalens TaxID=114155 RepID=A0A4Q9M8D8_9APHY|nr:hypothetical protein BD311DRAFT_731503 [Dichomitus squalens]
MSAPVDTSPSPLPLSQVKALDVAHSDPIVRNALDQCCAAERIVLNTYPDDKIARRKLVCVRIVGHLLTHRFLPAPAAVPVARAVVSSQSRHSTEVEAGYIIDVEALVQLGAFYKDPIMLPSRKFKGHDT